MSVVANYGQHSKIFLGILRIAGSKNVVNKIIDIQKPGTEDKAHVFAMLDAFLQSQKAKKVFAFVVQLAQAWSTHKSFATKLAPTGGFILDSRTF